MRKFILIIVLFFGAAFVYLSFGELQIILQTLRQGNFWFILIALIIQLGWYVIAGLIFRFIYLLLGIDETIYRLSLLVAAANFVNIVTPSAGMGGMAVFIGNANRRGYSRGKITIASMLSLLFDYVAFLIVLALAWIVLIRRNDLNVSQIAASTVIFMIAVALGFLMWLGSRSAVALGNVLAQMARMVNRIVYPFLHREYLSETRAHLFAHEMAKDLRSLPERPRSLAVPLLYAFANKCLMMLILVSAFLAFQVPFSAGTIIGGFAISYLFLIVSPTPSGIGIVEGVMPLALSSLGVPWSQAVLITLAYRGITFWIPLAIGALALRLLERQNLALPKTEVKEHSLPD
jgi:uncharacterized protein (TIRG00374 family)